MFKVLSSIIVGIILLVSAIFLLLFTNSGNNFLRPYISSYLSNRLDMNIKLDSFSLRPNFLDMEAYVNGNNKIILNGSIDILKEKFNLDFFVQAKNLTTIKKHIASDVNLKGNIKGYINNFYIKGNGKLSGSNVDFNSEISHLKAKNLHLNMKKARINEILAFLNKPPYVSGIANININFNNLDINDLDGNANIDIPYGSVDTALIKRDFNITLPIGLIFKARSNSLLKNKMITSKINFSSNIAKIDTKKTIYNLKDKSFDSDYIVDIPNLKLLSSVIKTKLRGSFKATGEVKMHDKKLSYLISTFSLGGNAKIIGYDKTVKIIANSLRMDKILYMFYIPKYSYSNIDINGIFDNVGSNALSGSTKISLQNGKLNNELIYKDFNISVPENFSYEDNISITNKNNRILFASDLNSTIATLKITHGIFDTSLDKLTGKYKVDINDLSKLSFLIKREILGKANFNGSFKSYNSMLLASGKTNIFDTNTTYDYKNGDISINSKDINTLKLSQIFGYPPLFDSNGTMQAYYNPKWKKGVFSIILHNGRMMPNEFSSIVFNLSGFDMTKELYGKSILNGNIKDNIINFAFDMNSSKSLIKIYNAKLNSKNNIINAKYIVKIGDKDVEGDIEGNIDHPKIKVNSSSYIKNKIEKFIDKKVPKKYQAPLKQIINLFGG